MDFTVRDCPFGNTICGRPEEVENGGFIVALFNHEDRCAEDISMQTTLRLGVGFGSPPEEATLKVCH
jgi:hypothetical protein